VASPGRPRLHSIDDADNAHGVDDTDPHRSLQEIDMNRIAKILAPAALVLAAFGANASELGSGDLGTRAVQVGAQLAPLVVAPGQAVGEVAAGDLNTVAIAPAPVRAPSSTMARPRVESAFAVGA
jgi:hypothetical protein